MELNKSGNTYVAWGLEVPRDSNSSNSDGSTSSTVRFNTTSGFSIVKWTNPSGSTTVDYYLLDLNLMAIFTKGLGSCEWQVYHHKIGNNYKLYLDVTDAPK